MHKEGPDVSLYSCALGPPAPPLLSILIIHVYTHFLEVVYSYLCCSSLEVEKPADRTVYHDVIIIYNNNSIILELYIGTFQ